MSFEIINSDIRCEREERYDNLALYDNSYLKQPDHPHTAFIHSKLMECDPRCAGILSISSGIFNKVVQSYINGVGEVKTDQADIDEVEFVKHLTVNGVVGVQKYMRDDEEMFEVVPSDEIFYENDTPIRVFEFQIWDSMRGVYDYYTLKTYYFVWENQNKLYKMDGKNSAYWRELDLDTLWTETILWKKMEAFSNIELTGLDTLSIYIIEELSIYDVIKSLIFAIERKMISTDNEMILFIKEKLLLKGFKTMSDKEQDSRIWYQNAEASAEYISKNNPYVMQSWEVIEKQLKMVSSNTSIPLDDFWFEISSWIGSDSQKARRTDYENRVWKFRYRIQEALEYFLWEVTITWDDIGYTNKKEELETLEIGINNGIISLEEAVAQYYDISKEEALLLLSERNELTVQTQSDEQEVQNPITGNNE